MGYPNFGQISKWRLLNPPVQARVASPAVAGWERLVATRKKQIWGKLPGLGVSSALGLVGLSLADHLAREGQAGSQLLFWFGLLLLFTPPAFRLVSRGASRQERLGLVVLLALSLYLVKFLQSPVAFTYHDELLHWRTANDILKHQHLFEKNPVLPVSALYAGLENVTTALANLTGLSIFYAGTLVIGVARLLMTLGFFLFFERVSQSARIAGIASLIYLANPNYLFWGAQFAYEGLALPIVAMIVFMIARREQASKGQRVGFNLLILLACAAVITTHHITSYALIGILALWSVTSYLKNGLLRLLDWYSGQLNTTRFFKALVPRKAAEEPFADLSWTTVLVVVATFSWLVYVASITVGYLAPSVISAVSGLLRFIAGEESSRQLFKGYTGELPPAWEQIAGYASTGLILLGMPFGLLFTWLRYRHNITALALALGALGYPTSMAMRLTKGGMEASNRSSEFLFVVLGFVIAVAINEIRLRFWLEKLVLGLVAVGLIVMFVGGAILGWPRWLRLPEPYAVAADMRSIQTDGVATAYWARDYLGPNRRFFADRTDYLLLLSYGEQYLVSDSYEGWNIAGVYFAPEIGQTELETLRGGKAQYLIVDRRLSSGLPLSGVYFEAGEPDSRQHITPFNPALFDKFDQNKKISRVFDNGNMQIYDVRLLSGVP